MLNAPCWLFLAPPWEPCPARILHDSTPSACIDDLSVLNQHQRWNALDLEARRHGRLGTPGCVRHGQPGHALVVILWPRKPYLSYKSFRMCFPAPFLLYSFLLTQLTYHDEKLLCNSNAVSVGSCASGRSEECCWCEHPSKCSHQGDARHTCMSCSLRSEETKTISKLFPAALIASYACFRSGVNCRHGGHLYRE